MKYRVLVFSCLFSFFPVLALAWNAMGHMLVAQIAYEQLTPAAKKKADELGGIVGKEFPKVNSFVAGAPWADDIKGNGITEYNTWHYINVGFSDDGTFVPQPPEPNVITGIHKTIEVIQDPRSDIEQQAAALYMLVHLVGDLHQPMHAITQFSRSLPQGDAGGNGFTLKGSYKNLHSLWDSSVEAYTSNPSRPLSSKNANLIRTEALGIMQKFSANRNNRLEKASIEEWVEETFDVGLEHAYYGIRKNDYPSDAYKKENAEIARDQINVAGHRLAIVLNELFR